MSPTMSSRSSHRLVASVSVCLLGACANLNPVQEVGAITAFGANSPTNEVRQIYYLGVFDPREQVPPTIYRVRVSGQASMISGVRFASGWVPAQIADSLGARFGFDENGNITMTGSDDVASTLLEGRTMMAFGPEGYRKAPKDHRLVIVMGSSPESYFGAVDEALGTIAQTRAANLNLSLSQKLLRAVGELESEERQLNAILNDAPGGDQ